MKTDAGSHPEANLCAPGTSPSPQTVLLVGFMGAGKSSVGKALARQLGWTFEDLDERVEGREKRTVEQIFRESGESNFRQAEHAALRELLEYADQKPRVIALGGGAFVQPNNAALVQHKQVPTVFLDAPVDELYRRCQQQPLDRPLRRSQEEFRKLYEVRRPFYLAATVRVETSGLDIDKIAAKVARTLGLLGS